MSAAKRIAALRDLDTGVPAAARPVDEGGVGCAAQR
jgi:hypothetical protein